MATTQIKNGYNGGSDSQLLVNPDGSINVNSSGGGGGNASVGATGAPVPASGTQIAGVDPDGNLTAVSVDENGFVNVQGVSTIVGPVEQAGLNSFQTSQYVIGTSVVQITPTPLSNRSSVSFRVEATPNIPVYIGNSNTVSAITGYPLYDGDTLSMDLTPSDTIYAISTAADQVLAVLELA